MKTNFMTYFVKLKCRPIFVSSFRDLLTILRDTNSRFDSHCQIHF